MKKLSLIIILIAGVLPSVTFGQTYNLKITLTKRSWCSVPGCYSGWDGTLYLGENYYTGPLDANRGERIASFYLPEVASQLVYYYTVDGPIAGMYANTKIAPHGCTDCHPVVEYDSDWLPGSGEPCGARSVGKGLMYLEYSMPKLKTPWPVGKPENYFQTNSLLCSEVITIQTNDYNVGDEYHWQINPDFTANPDNWIDFAYTTSPTTALSKDAVAAALGVTPQSLTGRSLRLRVEPERLPCNFFSRASDNVEIVFDSNFPNLIDFTTTQSCPGGSNGTLTFTNVRRGNGSPYNFSIPLTFAIGLLNESTQTVFDVRNRNSTDGQPYQFQNLSAGKWVTAVFYHTGGGGIESPSGCTAFLDTITVTNLTPVSFSGITPDMPTCRDGTDGSLAVNIQNGRGPFTYNVNAANVSTSARSAVIPNLASGSHTVRVRDQGCNTSSSWDISQTANIGIPNSATLGNQAFNVACAGSASGIVALAVTNGVTNYSYRLENQSGTTVASTTSPVSSSTHSFTRLPAGNYRAFVTDGNGCTDVSPRDAGQWINIGVSPPISVASVTAVPTLCHGEAPGSGTGQLIFNTVSGGSGSYRFFANGVEGPGSTITGLNTGDYIPMVMDARDGASSCTWGGTSAYTRTITEPTAITMVINETRDPSCFGEGDGLIRATASNGTPFAGGSYTYTLNSTTRGFIESRSVVSYASLADIASDSYYFTVSDRNNCVVDSRDILGGTIDIGQPDLLRINPVFSVVSGGTHNITCADSTDGWIQVNPTGGTAPYRARLYRTDNSGSPVEQYDNLPPGGSATYLNYGADAYTVVVDDAQACETVLDTLLIEPEPLLIDAIIEREYEGGVNVTCNGSADGEVTIDASGGNFPYSLSISGGLPATLSAGQIPHTVSGFEAGTYEVHITDPNGCTIREEFELIQPDPLLVSDIYISNPGASPFEVQCHGNTETLSIITSGGSVQRTVEINSVVRTVFAGDVADFPSLGADTYTYNITDANNCVLTDNITITQPDAISLNETATDIDKPRCFGENTGSMQLKALGGVKIDGTRYRYVLTHLNVPPDLPFYFEQVRELQGDTVVFEQLIAGDYQIAVYDRFTCLYTTTMSIETEAQIAFDITSTDITCKADANGSGTVTVSGGVEPYNLRWQNAYRQQISAGLVNESVPSNLNNLAEGIYYIRVSDASGCEFYNPNFTFEVRGPSDPLVLASQVSNVTCNGFGNGIVILEAAGGWREALYSYGTDVNDLSPENTFYENLTPGVYTFFVRDSRGCVDTLDVAVTEPNELVSAIASEKMVSCFGAMDGRFDLDVSGGTLPYYTSIDNGSTWIPSVSFDHLDAGTYTAGIRDANDCTSEEVIVITQPLLLEASIDEQVNTLCKEANGRVEMEVVGGTTPYSLAWRNEEGNVIGNNLIVNNLFAGNYTFTVTDENECTAEVPVTIINTNDIIYEVVDVEDVLCYGDANGRAGLSISAIQAPYTIAWDNGAASATVGNLTAGIHTVTLSDANHCEVTKEFVIDTPQPLGVAVVSETSPVCYGDCNGRLQVIATGGVGNYSYAWLERNVTSPVLAAACAGDHTIKIEDNNGCQFRKVITLTGPAEIDLGLNDSYSICQGQTVNLSAGNWVSYQWTSDNGYSSTLQSVVLVRQGAYDLFVTDEKGCQGHASFRVLYSNDLLKAEFLLPRETYVGDTIVCIDISHPAPGQIAWDFNDDAVMTIATYGAYKELVFLQPGNFDIVLTASVGECIDQQTKTITVFENDPGRFAGGRLGYRESGIRSFRIFPNPSDGKFKARILLYREAQLSLRLAGFNGNLMSEYVRSGADEYEVAIDISNQPSGIYWLIAEADGQLKTLRILIR